MDLDSYFERRAGVGKGPHRPDKFESSEQSDQDRPGESDNGDEESVELDLKSHPLFDIQDTALDVAIGLAIDIFVRRWLGRTPITGAVPHTQGAERQDKGARTRKGSEEDDLEY